MYLLFDETYRDITYGKPLPVAATLSDKAISVCSMSKSWGVPGIRIGWLVTKNQSLMDMFIAAKEQIGITGIPGASEKDMQEFYERLKTKYKTYVAPGYWFKMPTNYMRIGFGWTTPEDTQKGYSVFQKQ